MAAYRLPGDGGSGGPGKQPQDQMTDDDLQAMLAANKQDALNSNTESKLGAAREKALDYYYGDMSADMPSIEGRSKAVSTDVADTVEGLMPSLMEIFAGSDEVVVFDPVGPDDIDAAEQETDVVNHVFTQYNNGFLVLYTMIKDALLEKLGTVKVWTELETREEKEKYHNVTEDVMAVLLQKDASEIDITALNPSDEVPGTFDVEVTNKISQKRHRACRCRRTSLAGHAAPACKSRRPTTATTSPRAGGPSATWSRKATTAKCWTICRRTLASRPARRASPATPSTTPTSRARPTTSTRSCAEFQCASTTSAWTTRATASRVCTRSPPPPTRPRF